MLVLRWSQRAHYWFLGRPKGHIRGPKGHSALWKRPSENADLQAAVKITHTIGFLETVLSLMTVDAMGQWPMAHACTCAGMAFVFIVF